MTALLHTNADFEYEGYMDEDVIYGTYGVEEPLFNEAYYRGSAIIELGLNDPGAWGELTFHMHETLVSRGTNLIRDLHDEFDYTQYIEFRIAFKERLGVLEVEGKRCERLVAQAREQEAQGADFKSTLVELLRNESFEYMDFPYLHMGQC